MCRVRSNSAPGFPRPDHQQVDARPRPGCAEDPAQTQPSSAAGVGGLLARRPRRRLGPLDALFAFDDLAHFLHPGRLTGGDHRFGVEVGGHARGEDDVGHPHGGADDQIGDVHLEVGGDVRRPGPDGQGEQLLVEDPVGPVQLQGLAHQGDRDFGGDLPVGVDHLEVHMDDRVPHRMALELPGHGHELGVPHLERQHGVHAGVGVQRRPQVTGGHGDRDGVDAVAVDDGRDPAVLTQTAGRAGPDGPARFGDQGELGHEHSSSEVVCCGRPA